jgi:hypothetical protein
MEDAELAAAAAAAPGANAPLLERVRAVFAVDLHPSRLQDVAQGVREHLNGMLLQ